MKLHEWFDPTDRHHIESYYLLMANGYWPDNFMEIVEAEKLETSAMDSTLIAFKLAGEYVHSYMQNNYFGRWNMTYGGDWREMYYRGKSYWFFYSQFEGSDIYDYDGREYSSQKLIETQIDNELDGAPGSEQAYWKQYWEN